MEAIRWILVFKYNFLQYPYGLCNSAFTVSKVIEHSVFCIPCYLFPLLFIQVSFGEKLEDVVC